MCIIIASIGSHAPSREHLENSICNNPDGSGYAICTADRKLITNKSLDDQLMVNEYLNLMASLGDSVIASAFHARIATHGTIKEANCHPFMVGDAVMFHNGIIKIHQDKGDDRTDSETFASDYLTHLGGVPHEPTARIVIEDFIGYSKLVFIDPNAENPLVICNEAEGHWVGYSWYSNSSYRHRQSWTNAYWYDTYPVTTLSYDDDTEPADIECEQCCQMNDASNQRCDLCNVCLWCNSWSECLCDYELFDESHADDATPEDYIEAFESQDIEPF